MKNKQLIVSSSIKRLTVTKSIMLYAAILVLFTGCAPRLNHLSNAQDAFSKGAEIENNYRYNQVQSNLSPDLYYNLAYSEVEKSLKESEKLNTDGLLGNAYTIRSLSEWKLRKYASAKKSALLAIDYIEKNRTNPSDVPRDLVIMKAMDALIEIDSINNELVTFFTRNSNAPTIEQAKAFYEQNIYNVADQKKPSIKNALVKIDKIRKGYAKRNKELSLYLYQVQLAAMKGWIDSKDYINTLVENRPQDTDLSNDIINWLDDSDSSFNKDYTTWKTTLLDGLKDHLPGGISHKLYGYWSFIIGG